jgi:hypothetical protein
MTPVVTSALSVTPSRPTQPTRTVGIDEAATGAPTKDRTYCGVRGEPAGTYFIAEFIENRSGVPVTLEGCYEFCDVSPFPGRSVLHANKHSEHSLTYFPSERYGINRWMPSIPILLQRVRRPTMRSVRHASAVDRQGPRQRRALPLVRSGMRVTYEATMGYWGYLMT